MWDQMLAPVRGVIRWSDLVSVVKNIIVIEHLSPIMMLVRNAEDYYLVQTYVSNNNGCYGLAWYLIGAHTCVYLLDPDVDAVKWDL